MKSSPRALCIVPPTGRYIRESRCQTSIEKLKTVALRPPIDLLYAAAGFERGGCECLLSDYPAEEWGWDQLREQIAAFRPKYLVLEITTPSLDRDLKAADIAKAIDPFLITIAKGAHFNIFDHDTLERYPALDVVMRGEYESACEEMAAGAPFADILGLTWRDASGGIIRNADRPFQNDLDAFPFPARHLLRNELYRRPDTGAMQTTLVTNRGCPYRCVFCLANQVAGPRNRYRSVENVMAEITDCVERHGIRSFLFRSDLFTQDKQWVIKLCQAILDSGLDIDWAANSRVDSIDDELLGWMKKAGCWIVAFGIESGNDENLKRMNKKADTAQALRAVAMTRQAGLLTSVYMLMGMPWDTAESLRADVDFFIRLDADFTEIFFICPFPGTPLYDLAVKKGLLAPGQIPPDAYSVPAMATETLSMDELVRLRQQALRRLYLRPRYIARTLTRAARQGALWNYIRYGVQELADIVRSRKK